MYVSLLWSLSEIKIVVFAEVIAIWNQYCHRNRYMTFKHIIFTKLCPTNQYINLKIKFKEWNAHYHINL